MIVFFSEEWEIVNNLYCTDEDLSLEECPVAVVERLVVDSTESSRRFVRSSRLGEIKALNYGNCPVVIINIIMPLL